MSRVKINTSIKRDEKGRFIKGYNMTYDILKMDLERLYTTKRQSMKEVGEKYGCSWGTIRSRLKEYGISIRTSGGTARGKVGALKGRFKIFLPSKEVLEQLYTDEKISCQGIAKKYKCSGWTINYRLNYFGIPKRNQSLAVKFATSGKDNPNWKGGITPLTQGIRHSFKNRQWISDVFTRDDFTCQMCGDNKGGNLEAHHKKTFSSIIQKYEITTIKEASNCEELWNINNGVTLCRSCHHLRHLLDKSKE